MPREANPPLDTCPFIDDDDPGCAERFTLNHISEAMTGCVGGYRSCPNFWRLARRHPQRLVMITAHGRPLQPTGT